MLGKLLDGKNLASSSSGRVVTALKLVQQSLTKWGHRKSPFCDRNYRCLCPAHPRCCVPRASGLVLTRKSDSDHSDFATGSPDEPFHVDPVACKNHGFLAKSRRHDHGIDHIRRSGQAQQSPCFMRLALTERNDRATSQEAPELGLL